MKNILSYKLGTIFSGKEIKEWIKYHTENQTSKTDVAKKMVKYLDIADDEKYFLYKGNYRSSASYNEYIVENLNNRRGCYFGQ